MTRIKLKDNGGYAELFGASDLIVRAEKFLGHWNVKGSDLKEQGVTGVLMEEYAFLPCEVTEVKHGFC